MLENALQLALYSKENSVPLKFLKTIDGNLVDTTKAITDDILNNILELIESNQNEKRNYCISRNRINLTVVCL